MIKTTLYIVLILLYYSCDFTKSEQKENELVKNVRLPSKSIKIKYSKYDLSDFCSDYKSSKFIYTTLKGKIPQKFLSAFKNKHFNDFTLYNKNEPIPGVINHKGCQDCPNKILNFCLFNDSICFISYVVQPYTEHSVIEFLKFSKKIQLNEINIYENINDTIMINALFSNKLHYTPE